MEPVKARRPWWQWAVIGIVSMIAGCCVLSAVITALSGGSQRTTAANAPTRTLAADAMAVPTVLPQSTSAPAPTDAPAPTPEPTNTPVPEPTALPAIGADVHVGDIRWKLMEATDVGDTLKSDNQFIKPKVTAGKWLRLRLEVENQSADPKSFTGVDLVDDKGRKFNSSSETFGFIPEEERCIFKQLSANVPSTCSLYFELPKDAAGLRAVVGDFALFGATDQEISLGF